MTQYIFYEFCQDPFCLSQTVTELIEQLSCFILVFQRNSDSFAKDNATSMIDPTSSHSQLDKDVKMFGEMMETADLKRYNFEGNGK